nr:DUF2306 domain-containing protein [Georgenia subflava]
MITGLIMLSLIPVIAGSVRLAELSGDPEVTAANARFVASPLPVVLHVVSATLYTLVGAFQFSPNIRRRWPRWHRGAGRVLVVAGLTVAGSALWMAQFYPRIEGSGDLLYLFRMAFATAMVVSIVLAFVAIRRREIARHRAWMTRAYALGLGAGTQVFTLWIGGEIFGRTELSNALLMGTAWSINLVVAEWAIRRRPTHRRPARKQPARGARSVVATGRQHV